MTSTDNDYAEAGSPHGSLSLPGVHSRSNSISRGSSMLNTPRSSIVVSLAGQKWEQPTRSPPRFKESSTRVWLRLHAVVIVYSAVALALLVLLVYLSFFAAEMEDGSNPEFLGCRYWGFGASCGLWGLNCRPFETEWTAFRCPKGCALDQSSALAVYGSGLYRGDSRICRAAIHAGVIGPNGGCGLFRYAGAASAFLASDSNGVASTEFMSWFPKTMMFRAASSSFCTDLSWWILATGMVSTAGLALLPGITPIFMFHMLVAWGFFYVRVVGQPSSIDYTAIHLDSFGEVLVLLAAASLAYRVAAERTFTGWERMKLQRRVLMWSVCYVIPCHVLLNMNLISSLPWLNVDLGGHEESEANTGTYIVYGLLGGMVLWLAIVFMKQFYHLGLWKKYASLYALVIALVLLCWAFFPSTTFHLHHTMLGAFLIPLTGFSTPVAALAQSVALGCFLQGYTRWGWSSFLDITPTYLTIAVPKDAPIATNVTSTTATMVWDVLELVDAYSLRLNDVEVYRGLDTSAKIAGLQSNLTYFVAVAGVANWGTDGRVGPETNFTTLPG